MSEKIVPRTLVGYLNQLPKVPEAELRKDSCCMICHREYGTDSADVAVMLPCKHHVGLECISTWLSMPRKNSCPMCRRVFYKVIDHEDVEEYRREVVRRVGLPPQERHAQSRTWYDYFVQAAAEQYTESLTRAREFFASNSLETWFSDREELEYNIAKRATAFRTLAVREMMLYIDFGHDGGFPPIVGPIAEPLNAEQLEALFQELRRRGAFQFASFEPFVGLSDRQIWLLHREAGECYTTERGEFWSLGPG